MESRLECKHSLKRGICSCVSVYARTGLSICTFVPVKPVKAVRAVCYASLGAHVARPLKLLVYVYLKLLVHEAFSY